MVSKILGLPIKAQPICFHSYPERRQQSRNRFEWKVVAYYSHNFAALGLDSGAEADKRWSLESGSRGHWSRCFDQCFHHDCSHVWPPNAVHYVIASLRVFAVSFRLDQCFLCLFLLNLNVSINHLIVHRPEPSPHISYASVGQLLSQVFQSSQ